MSSPSDTRITTDVAEAVRALRDGRLVAFPTETVYGLGADARNPAALRRLYEVKGRPTDHPVIVHIARIDDLERWASRVPPEARVLADAFWPGPLTLILPRAEGVLDQVTGGQETIGLRMPNHPVALELLRGFGGGVAAPSANRFGRLSPTLPEHVKWELGGQVDLILEGGAPQVGLESTIVSLAGGEPAILRPGHIRPDQVSAVLGHDVPVVSGSAVRAAGTLPNHYAPDAHVRVLDREELVEFAMSATDGLGVLARMPAPENLPSSVHWIEAPANAENFARSLYASLRSLDSGDVREILVEAVPQDDPTWLAVADRLRRASA